MCDGEGAGHLGRNECCHRLAHQRARSSVRHSAGLTSMVSAGPSEHPLADGHASVLRSRKLRARPRERPRRSVTDGEVMMSWMRRSRALLLSVLTLAAAPEFALAQDGVPTRERNVWDWRALYRRLMGEGGRR